MAATLIRQIFTTDHRAIARRFLVLGLTFLALGGALALAIRWQWAYPGRPIPGFGWALRASGGAITPAAYQVLFTMHGLVMIFFAVTPILIGCFTNLLLPSLLGAREMAFPRLSAASFWLFALSQGMVAVSFFVELGSAGAGWTGYPPLSTRVGSPGAGQTWVIGALGVTSLSTLLGAANAVTTVIRQRAPGMGYLRMPLTVWGLWLTAILNVLFVPVLVAASALLLLDRLAGTQFFIAGAAGLNGGGDPILYQHLFWIFGHPEVYILILPAWGYVGDLLAFFSRKPAYAYRATVTAMVMVAVLSGLVYGHHMFVSGMNPMLGKAFMLLTLVISIPSGVLGLNWIQTLWKGSVQLDSPMLFALGTVLVFGMGGLTGLYLGAVSTDIYLHDTLWVVGHFHLTMASATFLALFAALHFWFPKLFGRRLDERWAKAHFWLTLPLLVAVFTGQLAAGYAGQQRRLYDPYQYEFLRPLLPLNRATSYAAFALAAAQLLFVFNFFKSLRSQPLSESNPWQVGTLEWTADLSTAAPAPVLNGPHLLSHPEVRAHLGRDWLGQAEAWPLPSPPAEPDS